MNFRRNTGLALGTSVLSGPVVLLGAVVLARWLSPAENGQVQAALSLLALLATVGNGGLVAATIHRMRSAKVAPALAIGSALAGVTAIGLLWMLGLYVLGPWVRSTVLLGLSPLSFAVMGLAVLPLLWGSVLGAGARGLDQFGWWSRAELGQKVGRAGAFAVVAMVWPPSVLYAVTVVVAVQVGITWGLGTRVLRKIGTPVVSWDELRAAGRYGLSAWATTGAHQLHERVDLVLLAVLRGDPVEVAAYAVAVAVVNRLRMVPLALASALFPQVSGMETEAGAAFTAQVCRLALAASVVLGVGVAAVAYWAFPLLFGPAYTASVIPAWLLVPGVVALTPYLVLSRWFQAQDKQGVNVGVLAVALALNVGLNLLWIPQYGAAGAAAASLVSYGLQGLGIGGFFVRATGLGVAGLLWPRATDLALLRRD